MFSLRLRFQDAADSASTAASSPNRPDSAYPESPALPDTAAAVLSVADVCLRPCLHVWRPRSARPAPAAGLSRSSTLPVAPKSRDFLRQLLLVLFDLLRLLPVPRGLRCLSPRGASAHQPTTPTVLHQTPAAASVCHADPHPVQTERVEPGVIGWCRSKPAGSGPQQLRDGEVKPKAGEQSTTLSRRNKKLMQATN